MAILETMENATVELLTTHYYKASYDDIKEVYLTTLKNMKYEVISVNDDYCEIVSEGKGIFVTAKIIMQTPRETSIDFYIDENSLFGGTRKGAKFINEVYKAIQKLYELKGLGLHK